MNDAYGSTRAFETRESNRRFSLELKQEFFLLFVFVFIMRMRVRMRYYDHDYYVISKFEIT